MTYDISAIPTRSAIEHLPSAGQVLRDLLDETAGEWSGHTKDSGTGWQTGSREIARIAEGRMLDSDYYNSLNTATFVASFGDAPIGWWQSEYGWFIPRQDDYVGEGHCSDLRALFTTCGIGWSQ